MHLTWKQRLARHSELWQFDRWPLIHPEDVPAQHREKFMRNKFIVAAVLSGGTMTRVAQEHALSTARISMLMSRCLGGAEDHPPALTGGLVPFGANIQEPRQRRTELPTLTNQRGSACAFSALLAHLPALKRALDDMISAAHADDAHAQKLSPRALHSEFKRVLASLNWPASHYPYTQSSMAYESVRQYGQRKYLEIAAARVSTRLASTMPYRKFLANRKALRAVQIDEHLLDVRGKIAIIEKDQISEVPIARVSLLLAVDVDTLCNLGFHISYSAHPNQEDMLALIDNCISPQSNKPLHTPDLHYTPGAMFPNALQNAAPLSFGVVQLDNAWFHSANSVMDFLCEKMGATLCYGLPAMPTVRGIVEHAFGVLCQKATHRFASTTGSHSRDPKRESAKNRKKLPAVTIQELEEIISVTLTNYNVTPNSALQGLTPLQAFQRDREQRYGQSPPRLITQQWRPYLRRVRCTLHWPVDEKRRAYVNFYYVKYKGQHLTATLTQRKSSVWVEYDVRDIRQLTVFSTDGTRLGTVHAPKSWQHYPHSVSTRKLICQRVRSGQLSANDPLASYFRNLLDSKNKPLQARQLLRVHRQFPSTQTSPDVATNAVSPSPLSANKQSTPAPFNRTVLNDAAQAPGTFQWSRRAANHEGLAHARK
jgi:putative transposase